MSWVDDTVETGVSFYMLTACVVFRVNIEQVDIVDIIFKCNVWKWEQCQEIFKYQGRM